MSEKKSSKELVYTINLSRLYWGRRANRAARAVRYLRQWVARRTKAKEVVIGEDVNRLIWSRGIEKPPRKLRVRVIIEGPVEEKTVKRTRIVRDEKGEEKKKMVEEKVVVSVEKAIVRLYDEKGAAERPEKAHKSEEEKEEKPEAKEGGEKEAGGEGRETEPQSP